MTEPERPFESRRAQPPAIWRPIASYALLGTIVAVYVLQLLAANSGRFILYRGIDFPLDYFAFIINIDWPFRPWTLVTSTFAHGGPQHLLFNGLFLFFFGPTVERLLGAKRLVILFLVAGAVSGIIQVHLSAALGAGGGALGASGALMMLFGILMILLPREKIHIWGIIPVPMWAAGIGYAALDILGALNPYSDVGNFAHLSGMALGLAYGLRVKNDWKQRGVQLVRS